MNQGLVRNKASTRTLFLKKMPLKRPNNKPFQLLKISASRSLRRADSAAVCGGGGAARTDDLIPVAIDVHVVVMPPLAPCPTAPEPSSPLANRHQDHVRPRVSGSG